MLMLILASDDLLKRHVVCISPSSLRYNTSLSPPAGGGDPYCPSDEIQHLHDLMFPPSERGEALTARFTGHFLPDFVVTGGAIHPEGACLGEGTPANPPDTDLGYEDITHADGGHSLSISGCSLNILAVAHSTILWWPSQPFGGCPLNHLVVSLSTIWWLPSQSFSGCSLILLAVALLTI